MTGVLWASTPWLLLWEEPITLAEVYEPYLIMQGFLKRTLRGREATAHAYKHLGHPPPLNIAKKK